MEICSLCGGVGVIEWEIEKELNEKTHKMVISFENKKHCPKCNPHQDYTFGTKIHTNLKIK